MTRSGMSDSNVPTSVPPGWIDALTESVAQIRAGHTVPMEPALARLQASIDRMEARRAARV
jgi:hypothetical protein